MSLLARANGCVYCAGGYHPDSSVYNQEGSVCWARMPETGFLGGEQLGPQCHGEERLPRSRTLTLWTNKGRTFPTFKVLCIFSQPGRYGECFLRRSLATQSWYLDGGMAIEKWFDELISTLFDETFCRKEAQNNLQVMKIPYGNYYKIPL